MNRHDILDKSLLRAERRSCNSNFRAISKTGNGESGNGNGESGNGNGERGMGMGNLLKGRISKRGNY